jgi:hypothetical protein
MILKYVTNESQNIQTITASISIYLQELQALYLDIGGNLPNQIVETDITTTITKRQDNQYPTLEQFRTWYVEERALKIL